MLAALILASAESSDQSFDLLVLILESLSVLAGMAIVAAVPLMVAGARRRPHFLPGACLVWGLVAAGDLIYLLFARYRWLTEYNKLVMSAYFDPADRSGQPRPHWIAWLALLVVYAVLVVIAIRSRGRNPGEVGASRDHASNGRSHGGGA